MSFMERSSSAVRSATRRSRLVLSESHFLLCRHPFVDVEQGAGHVERTATFIAPVHPTPGVHPQPLATLVPHAEITLVIGRLAFQMQPRLPLRTRLRSSGWTLACQVSMVEGCSSLRV